MNTEFIRRERARIAREAAGESVVIEARIDGFGMNRTPAHVATPAIYGVMATRDDVDTTKRPKPADMRRKSQVRDKGHKFHALDSRGAVPYGVSDDSVSAKRETPVNRNNTGINTELPSYCADDLSAKYGDNLRNMHKQFVSIVVRDKKTGKDKIIPLGWKEKIEP